jgi:hypothetical protein
MTGRVRQSTGAGRVRGAPCLSAWSIEEERVQTTDCTLFAWATANFQETREREQLSIHCFREKGERKDGHIK